MYCANCGAEAREGMAFCAQCGARLAQNDEDVQGVAEAPTPEPGNARKKRIVPIVIAAVCIVVIVAVAVVGYTIMKKDNEAKEIAHQTVVFELPVEAAGLDYASSTPVPMQVSGTDFSGNEVSHEFLYDGSSDSVPPIERGQYTISVLDSPISGNGTMYALTNPEVSVSVTDYEAEQKLRELGHEELIGSVQAEGPDTACVTAGCTSITLTPLAAIDVTDEMINATCGTLEGLGYDATKLVEHRQLVESARDVARQEELERQTTFSDERFSLKVPASWAGHWTNNCKVTHSVQGGMIPNAWEYHFYNTNNSAQGFTIFVEDGGSYGADRYTELPSSNSSARCFIRNDGLSSNDYDAVVSSFVAK